MSAPGYLALTASDRDLERESFVDDLVGMVRGIVAARQDACYGSLVITHEQTCEIANAVVMAFLVACDIRPAGAR